PLMPGKYYLVITLPKTAYGYYAKTVIPFTIEKAVINISTPSFEIYQGQETFPEVPITFTGFVNKETAAVFNVNTLKAEHSVPDTVVPGKYPIRYTGELSSDRYNFNYSAGVLTIVKVAKYPAVDPIPEKISGITVYVPPKSLPDKIDSFEELALSINAISPADDRLITQVMQNKSGFKNYKKMDIKLIEILTGKAVQPKGKVTISMPYPNGSDSTMNFKVLHLLKNGTKIEVITPTKVVGGLQFKVSEFSPFIIGWEPNIKTEDTDFFITNAQITTEKKQFTVAVRENARKASYALTKFFEASTGEKSVVLKNPDVIITFDKNALKVTDNSPSYDFYATKNACEHELAARALGGEGVLAVIHFNQEGYWPGTAQVSVNMGKELKGTELAYYYYNQDGQSLDYVTKAVVDKDGWFTVPQDHCSDYVISTEFPKIIPPSPSPSPTPEAPVEPEEKESFLTKVLNFVKKIPAFIMALPQNVKNTFENVKAWSTKTFGGVAAFFSKITKPISKIFGKVGDKVSGFFGGIKDKVSKTIDGVKTSVGNTVDGVKETVGNGVSTVKDNIVLFVGLIIVLALILLIVLLIIKIIKKKRGDDEDDEETTQESDEESDEDDDEDSGATPPGPKSDDDIEY
ncbi:MAG: MBG domain-containing protein, partial [Oscillospiraceae bacterium]